MKRNILDVQFEIKVWELKRDTLCRDFEAVAGSISEIMADGYRTAIADCVAKINELRGEIMGPRTKRAEFIITDEPVHF